MKILDSLKIKMYEVDKQYLECFEQLRRNRKRINILIEQNEKMDARERKYLGRFNNKLIRKIQKESGELRLGLALNNPLGEFKKDCLANKIDFTKARQLFSEIRGGSILEHHHLL